MDSINKDIEEMIYITCLGVDITIGGVHRQVIIMDSSYRAAGILKSNSSLLRIFLYWGPRQATPGHSRPGRFLTARGPRRVAVSPDWDSGLLSLSSLSTVQSCQPRGGETGSARNQWSLMFIIPANNTMIKQYHNQGTFLHSFIITN